MQREKIDLDRQEAAALQPLIDAQQKLKDYGLEGAAEKVDALKEKMYEVANLVNQIAESIRTKLCGALEALSDSMDRGQKALEQFNKSIENIVLDQTFKQFVAPVVQTGLGALIPNGKHHGTTSGFCIGSALGDLIPGVGKLGAAVGLKGRRGRHCDANYQSGLAASLWRGRRSRFRADSKTISRIV